MNYEIPKQFFFRIHHVRPRFKCDVENVLLYMADSISGLKPEQKDVFRTDLNSLIKAYPGNSTQTQKTIDNWRTEISSLFSLFQIHGDVVSPGLRAKELAKSGDVVEFFKEFLFLFQYPGGHIKPKSVLEQIEHGVHFKPAQYLLSIFQEAKNRGVPHFRLSKAEVCHCVFNDLRATSCLETPSETLNRILENKENNVTYDESGDVIRYAGDILDYMYIANLLNNFNGEFSLNSSEGLSISTFLSSTLWFSGYDKMISSQSGSIDKVSSLTESWLDYANQALTGLDFTTDVSSLLEEGGGDSGVGLKENTIDPIQLSFEEFVTKLKQQIDSLSTKSIGDIGEGLVTNHEQKKLQKLGLNNLVHLVKKIPTQLSVGYDIQSFEGDGTNNKKYIEVKTTISANPLKADRVHLTANEWNSAQTLRRSYYIYRVQITKKALSLFVVNDPVGLYKTDKIVMTPKDDGAELQFSPQKVGHYEEIVL
jgi:hypothetical protein